MSKVERLQQRMIRQQMISQVAYVWDACKQSIDASKEELLQALREQNAKNLLQESYRILDAAIEDLSYNEEYIKEEDPMIFKELVGRLVEVFKNALKSFSVEDHRSTSTDKKIDDLVNQFYDTLAWMRGLSLNEFVSQAYPPITFLIRMVRNCQEHEKKPVDHITQKNSFGNVYTISSMLILSIHAYSEILQAWIDTLGIS